MRHAPRTDPGPGRAAPLALLLTLPCLALGLALAGQARAACDCGTISGIVRQAAERIVGGLGGLVDASVSRAANHGTQNIHRDLVALREAVLLGQESIGAAIRAADRDQAGRDFEKTWDLPSQPTTGCGNDDMGGELMLSRESVERAGQEIMDKIAERRSRHPRPMDYLVELGSFPGPGLAPGLLGALSRGRTLSLGELREAERLVESLSNPLPPQILPPGDAATPAGKVHEAQRRDYEARQALLQSVLARRLADRAPTVEGLGGWAAAKWRDMGGSGPVPGLADGRMSQEALFWLLANMRLASGTWHERILPQLPEAGLLREMASMMAVGLELSRRRNELLGDVSSLMALEGLAGLEAGPGEALRRQYRRALGSGAQ
jgi:hypothetical protein